MERFFINLYLSLPDYETISNNITFEEENPEWVSMDISLKVDPSGKTDPVIITRGEKTSDDGSIKKGSGKFMSEFYGVLLGITKERCPENSSRTMLCLYNF